MTQAATEEKIYPRDHWEPEPPLTASQWADEHRVLSSLTSHRAGPWRTDRTPYLREPLDSLSLPDVEEITCMFATQTGKTEFELNAIGFFIDHDPGPMMVVLPRDEDAKRWAEKRLKPMILSSPDVKRHTTGKEDDLAGKDYRLDRMTIKLAGANSPADLAGDPCRYVLRDEIDKFPRFSGRESSPMRLSWERTRSFPNRKVINVSTPTTKDHYVFTEFLKTDQRRFWVQCQRCGLYQILSFSEKYPLGKITGQIRWEEGATAETIRRDKFVWYECGRCKGVNEEHEKMTMLRGGVWCPEGAIVDETGKLKGEIRPTSHRGYQLSALYSPWVNWWRIAAEFLEAKDKPADLMNFVNSTLAMPWTEKAKETKESHLETLRDTYTHGQIPPGVVLLTAAVDVQLDHFWFVIRGWGFGEESWLIRYGRVETFQEIEHAIILTGYPRIDGGDPLFVELANMDANYRTNEVYSFCRDHAERFRPIKGHDHLTAAPMRTSLIDRYPNGIPIKEGLTLWHLDTTYFKDKLNRLIHTLPGNPGSFHLCADVEETYFFHMTAEHKATIRDKKTGATWEEWQPVTEGRANHLFDCEVYALAAAEMKRVFLLRQTGEVETYTPQAPRENSSWIKRGGSARGGRSSGWLGRRR